MGLTRMEINFRRLLNKCELMLKIKKEDDDRFPKYVESLEKLLKEMETATPCLTTEESIHDYHYRIHNLKLTLGMDTTDYVNGVIPKVNPREELLGLKHRGPQAVKFDDLDELIDHHEHMQQKIADDMLSLTRNLKEQSELASKVIKKDTEVVGRSTQLTDNNFSKLKVESDTLTEHSKRAWKCWMWVMLLVVMVVFINMVLFMKVMKKKY